MTSIPGAYCQGDENRHQDEQHLGRVMLVDAREPRVFATNLIFEETAIEHKNKTLYQVPQQGSVTSVLQCRLYAAVQIDGDKVAGFRGWQKSMEPSRVVPSQWCVCECVGDLHHTDNTRFMIRYCNRWNCSGSGSPC